MIPGMAGVLFGSIALVPAASAQTAGLDVLQFSQLVRNYNLVSIGDANLTFINNDTNGPLAVGGDLSIGNTPLVNFAQFASSPDPTVYVAGQLKITSGSTAMLNNGYASLPGMSGTGSWDSVQKRYTTPAGNGGGILSTINAAGGNVNSTHDPRSNPAPASWSFPSIKSTAVNISNNLAALAANGTLSVSNNNLNFNAGANTGIVIFSLNANLLNGNQYNGQSFSNININIPTNTEFVVNVTNAAGKTIFGTGNGVNFNQPGGAAGASQLLWNIVNGGVGDITTTLGNGGQFYGSVLAPMVALANAQNSPINGQILTDSITYSDAELHYTGFVAIPEPSAYAMLLGLGALGAALRRRLLQKTWLRPEN
jgi:choice-of-anchor A domain-containing protein